MSKWDSPRAGGTTAVTVNRTATGGTGSSTSPTTPTRTRSAWRTSPSGSAGRHRAGRRAERAQRRAARRAEQLSDSEIEALGRLAYVVLGGASIGFLSAIGYVELGPVGALAGALVAVLLTVMALMI